MEIQMKIKTLCIVTCLFVLLGGECDGPSNLVPEKRNLVKQYDVHGYVKPVDEVEIDGCQYLIWWDNVIKHKANCTNHKTRTISAESDICPCCKGPIK